MPLQVASAWKDVPPAGNWPLPGEPRYAEPDAYHVLRDDIDRYLRDEIGGRSYLIAGHRGAGKTALVLQAARRLRHDALHEAVNSDDWRSGRRGRRQRPLLVKIVGKSLIAPPPAVSTKSDELQEAIQDADGPSGNPAAHALVHVMIGLYRALAEELTTAAALHSRSDIGPHAAGRREVAAQLALALDAEPDAAQLRRYWHLLGRLEDGLLWPAGARVRPDQGLREIVAVATAAQAFQICAGKVTYDRKDKASASAESSIDMKGNFAETIGRATALLAGAAVGGAAFAGEEPARVAIGAGVFVWLLGSTTLNWSANRMRRRETTLDFNFIRDRTIQTLDRELPVVIERIREAGLAPVFVIDELDKLGDETDETIKAIINRLKHLLSDHGFFCFLTDRDYFDRIARKVATEVYPTEHTFFSRRLLVLQRPEQLSAYLGEMLEKQAPGTTQSALDPSEQFSRATFSLAVAYRSKLNFADVGRAVDGLIGLISKSAYRDRLVDDGQLRRRRLRLEAAIQLSVEQVLSIPPYRDIFLNDPDPGFVQSAMDAVYIIPRAWERNVHSEVAIDADSIDRALAERTKLTPAQTTGTQTSSGLSNSDLAVIVEMVRQQAIFLANFAVLKTAVSKRQDWVDRDARVSVIPSPTEGFRAAGLIVQGAYAHSFRFTVDENGIVPRVNGASSLDDARRETLSEGGRLAAEFVALCEDIGVSIDSLVAVGLLPPLLTAVLVTTAAATLSDAHNALVWDDGLEVADTTADSLAAGLQENGAWLAAAFHVVARLRFDLGPAIPDRELLRALARLTPIPSPLNGGHPPDALYTMQTTTQPSLQPLSPTATSVRELRAALALISKTF